MISLIDEMWYAYDVKRKNFRSKNKFHIYTPIISDHKIYHCRLDDKYIEFDKQGSNKSFSVLSVIRKQYIKLIGKNIDSCEIFYLIIDEIIKVIVNSKNYVEIPYEELELCVSILVVDAFIRCKIFKNPEGYNYAVTR